MMMSEKRFEVLFYGDVINCVRDENGKEYNLHELTNLLMDQQATINNQEQKIKILQQEINDTQTILEMLTEKLKGWNNE